MVWFTIVIVFYRRPPTNPLFAASTLTILLDPDSYTEKGQAIRRRYIKCLKGFFLGVLGALLAITVGSMVGIMS